MTSLRLPSDTWLDALDGVSYLVGFSGSILQVGRHWDRFARDNRSPLVMAEHVVGGDLFRMIKGESVRDAYRRMHESIVAGKHEVVCFTFRCDAPEAKRTMRMAISTLRNGDEVVALLYQSQLLSEVERPPLAQREWIAPEAYYARGGTSDVTLTHGICPTCLEGVVHPNT
jgi:hypothetical protein